MRTRLQFSLSVLGFIAMTCCVFVGCLDATEKDKKLNESYKESSTKRIAVINENFQNPTKKATSIKTELLTEKSDKQSWDKVFAVLKSDENIDDKRMISDLLCKKSDLRLIAVSKVANMGSQAYDILLESTKFAQTEAEIEYILETLSLALMKSDITETQTDAVIVFLRKTINTRKDKVQSKAVQLLAKIGKEADHVLLAKFLNIKDDITRLLIYNKLRLTSSTSVLVEIAKHLENKELPVRVYSVNILRQITGKYFAYNPGGELISRQIQAIRWQTYIQNHNKFIITH